MSCAQLLANESSAVKSSAHYEKWFGKAWTNDLSRIGDIQKAWEEVGNLDLTLHDPENFRYLVWVPREGLIDQKIQEMINAIPHRPSISMSLVDQIHRGTFLGLETGFILRVPSENIFASSTIDMGSKNARITPQQAIDEFGLATPEALIGKSHLQSWNEVRAVGTKGEKKIEVAGLFYFKKLYSNETSKKMIRLGFQLNLPVIELPAPQYL